MSKKLLMLLVGYVAGSVVTGLYADKKGGEIKKEMQQAKKKGEDDRGVLISYLTSIHKKFFGEVKDAVLTAERKEMLIDKQKEVMDIVAEYKEDAEKMIADLKKKGVNYAKEVYGELEDFSKLKTEEGEKRLKKFGTKVVKEFKTQATHMFKTLKSHHDSTKK